MENVIFQIKALGARQAKRDTDDVARSIDNVGKQAKGANRDVGRLDQSLKTMGAFRWASYAGFATVATGVAGVVHEALSFEDAMAKVRAITGASGQDFDTLWTGALDVAKRFRATGAETANALYEISAAGIEGADSMAVLEGSLALAAATGYDQALAAQLQIGTMNAFGLEVSDATHIADLFTNAVNLSAINMEDLGYSMKYLSAPARMANQSLEETLKMVALLGKAGARGTNVGTGLATGLQRLVDPTTEAVASMKELGLSTADFADAEGNIKPFTQILDLVAGQLAAVPRDMDKLRIAGDIFGKDAADVWMNLLTMFTENRDAVTELGVALDNSGGKAQDTAAVMNDTVNASLERMWGAITEITTGKLMTERGPIQDWLDGITEKIENFDLETFLNENRDTIEDLQKSFDSFENFVTNGLIPAITSLHDTLSPVVNEALDKTATLLGYMADHSAVLTPLIYALTAMWVAAKAAALAGALGGLGVPGMPGGGGPGGGGGGGGRGTGRGGGGRGGGGIPRGMTRGGAGRAAWPLAIAAAVASGWHEAAMASGQEDWMEFSLLDLGPWMARNVTNPAEMFFGTLTNDLSTGINFDTSAAQNIASGMSTRRLSGTELIPPSAVAVERVRADQFLHAGGGVPAPIHVHVEIDGREIAHGVAATDADLRARR